MKKTISSTFNEISNSYQFVRFFKLQYPIFKAPVNIIEKNVEEEFHVLEYYIDRLLVEGKINSFYDIVENLGMKGHELSLKMMIENLYKSNHIEIVDDVLRPTTLAAESVNKKKKIITKITKKFVYLDAVEYSPLPKKYYDNAKPRKLGKNTFEYLINPSDYFLYKSNLKIMIDFDAQQKLEFGLPLEMNSIDFDIDDQKQLEYCFIPLYIGIDINGYIFAFHAYFKSLDPFFTQLMNSKHIVDELMIEFYMKRDEILLQNQYFKKNLNLFGKWEFSLFDKVKKIDFTNENDLNSLRELVLSIQNNVNCLAVENFLQDIILYDFYVTYNEDYGHVISIFKNENTLEDLLNIYKEYLKNKYDNEKSEDMFNEICYLVSQTYELEGFYDL